MRRVPLVLAAAMVLAFAAPASADPPAPPGTPTAHAFDGTPTVGPIFRGALRDGHECTASVVASPSHDLVLTAAHCVYGDVRGWKFAPGYVKGRTPYGVWTVTAAFVDRAWLQHAADGGSSQHDVAILRVAPPPGGAEVEDAVGANVLAPAPADGSTIVDVAYNAGVRDRPIRCRTTAYVTSGYPSFNCHGYVGGSSGSPWLQRDGRQWLVRGVIGGRHQGGCYEYTSYSSSFGWRLYALLTKASRGGPGDAVPTPGGDGC